MKACKQCAIPGVRIYLRAGASLSLQLGSFHLGRGLDTFTRKVLAGNVSRWQRNTSDGTSRHVFDVGDILHVVVAVPNAPEDPGAKGKGNQEQEPRDEVLSQVRSLITEANVSNDGSLKK